MLCLCGRQLVKSKQEIAVPEIFAKTLYVSRDIAIRDTDCQGTCRVKSTEESTKTTQLVFPYRGSYVRHVGERQAIADANHVLFFNAAEGYRISHPVAGGDGSLTLIISEQLMRELSPVSLLQQGSKLTFLPQQIRIGPEAQALVARLRHGLQQNILQRLEVETLALTLVGRTLGSRSTRQASATSGQWRLADRAKLVLASDLTRRWSLMEVASELQVSPVYLTQVFQQVEGTPLYRYQLQLRVARALLLLPRNDDLTSLSLELGFSSHSHFTAAFRRLHKCSPSQFRRSFVRNH